MKPLNSSRCIIMFSYRGLILCVLLLMVPKSAQSTKLVTVYETSTTNLLRQMVIIDTYIALIQLIPSLCAYDTVIVFQIIILIKKRYEYDL